jgi:hypothetical protein
MIIYQIHAHSVGLPFALQQTLRQTILPSTQSTNILPTHGPKRSSQLTRVVIPAYQGPEGVSIVNPLICLIVQIVEILVKPADKPKDLTLELAALYKSLVMIRTAIEENKDSPLGLECLLNLITPEVNQCHSLLEELFNVVHGTWWGLDSCLGVLWLSVWQNRWEGNELLVLRRRLSRSRELFHDFQTAVKSYVHLTSGVTRTNIFQCK